MSALKCRFKQCLVLVAFWKECLCSFCIILHIYTSMADTVFSLPPCGWISCRNLLLLCCYYASSAHYTKFKYSISRLNGLIAIFDECHEPFSNELINDAKNTYEFHHSQTWDFEVRVPKTASDYFETFAKKCRNLSFIEEIAHFRGDLSLSLKASGTKPFIWKWG